MLLNSLSRMILVTGGTGLVGSHLILELLKKGEKVRATCRATSNRSILKKLTSFYKEYSDIRWENLSWFEVDLLDVPELEDAFEGVKTVYHCAAIVSFDPRTADKMLRENLETTANVVNLCLSNKVEKLVYVSSVAALGRKAENEPIDEKADWVESKNNSQYAKSKYRAELEVWRAVQEGLNAVVVNPSIILGPGNWKQGSAALFGLVAKGFKYYTPGANAYVDVRDAVDIMIRLMNSDITEERFVVASENLRYKDFFELLAEALKVKSPSIKVSGVFSAIMWRLEWLRTRILGGKPLITRETAHTAGKTYFYDNSKVKARLNFQFRTIQESVRDISGFYLRDHQ